MCALSALLASFIAGCASSPESPPIQAPAPIPRREEERTPHFSDVTPLSGVGFRHASSTRTFDYPGGAVTKLFGSGISIADYDGDGRPDIYFAGSPGALYRNLGNLTFEDVTLQAGLARSTSDEGRAGVFGDYDNDGCSDLYLTFAHSPNRLYRNRCDGTFVDTTLRAGVGYNGSSYSAAWGDYDRDGWLDLYVTTYATSGNPTGGNVLGFDAKWGEPDLLFRNNRDGTFAETTARAGVGDTGLGLAAVFSDLDGDMWPDLYVANDYGRNSLYLNQGDGTFRDATDRAGVGYQGNGMSADSADYDGDLRPDLFVTNIVWAKAVARDLGLADADMDRVREAAAARVRKDGGLRAFLGHGIPPDEDRFLNSGSALYQSNADGTWSERARQAGVRDVEWGWSAPFADFDNDGRVDLFAANGFVPTEGVDAIQGFAHLPDRLFLNRGDGTFAEVGAAAGVADTRDSRGAATGDLDGDGRLDLVVSHLYSTPSLYRNIAASGHAWLEVRLTGSCGPVSSVNCSNRDGVGAKVLATAGGQTQVREVKAGSGFLSQSDRTLHFGLGNATTADLEVRWPSGLVERAAGVAVNRTVEWTEGRGGPEEVP